MSYIKITAPTKGYNASGVYGNTRLHFEDSVATVEKIPAGVAGFLTAGGYEVEIVDGELDKHANTPDSGVGHINKAFDGETQPVEAAQAGTIPNDATTIEEAADEFDPADHTVDEVIAYLKGKDDTELTRVLKAEEAGKNRKQVMALKE